MRQDRGVTADPPTPPPADPDPHPGLDGALAVVVGASRGIGAAIAEALATSGARLVLAARDPDRLATSRKRCAAAGATEVDAVPVDVRSPDSIAALADSVRRRHGAPTVLVNSAGAVATKPALDVTAGDWDRIHEVQLRGPFLAMQAFAPAMAAEGYGKVVNLSSTWAATVAPGRSTYCAAKAGLSHLTAALAVEWAPLGIRVNAVAPTATRTPGLEERFAADPALEESLRGRIPLGRLAVPTDVVGAVLFLAGSASDFVTGHTLYVDGGWRFAR
jgi:NAD(P)-dependent dehydrogenase (short-subunit alcohol dehydrogenase family)